MTRGTFFKFFFLSLSNAKRLVVVNLVFLPVLALFSYCFINLIPLAVRYIDSINLSVLQVNPAYDRLAIVVVGTDGGEVAGQVYVFKRSVLRSIRRYLFAEGFAGPGSRILREKAIAFGEIKQQKQVVTLRGEQGEPIVTIRADDVKPGSVEILFYRSRSPVRQNVILLYAGGLLAGFLLLSGSFCGISDYTQRVVFHETRGFSYLFRSIRRSFGRSLIISLVFSVIIGAVIANIYFYIFIMSTDASVFIAAINFWMLVFFLLILLWVYPISVMNRDESLWRVMKKSLFVSFDNFDFTLHTLLLIVPMGVLSAATVCLLPGISGVFSYLNTALKELSSRYSAMETEEPA
jgi:hypothetical protein